MQIGLQCVCMSPAGIRAAFIVFVELTGDIVSQIGNPAGFLTPVLKVLVFALALLHVVSG